LTRDATLKRDFLANVVGPGISHVSRQCPKRGRRLWELGKTRNSGTYETIVPTKWRVYP